MEHPVTRHRYELRRRRLTVRDKSHLTPDDHIKLFIPTATGEPERRDLHTAAVRSRGPNAGDRLRRARRGPGDALGDRRETDMQRLEQVLKNLLSNAIKFTEAGQVRLSIRRAGEGQIAFSVSDTGIGIAEEQQRSVFEAFHQADSTISRKYGVCQTALERDPL